MGQHKSLLVGFGGTGGKALKEFAVKFQKTTKPLNAP